MPDAGVVLELSKLEDKSGADTITMDVFDKWSALPLASAQSQVRVCFVCVRVCVCVCVRACVRAWVGE